MNMLFKTRCTKGFLVVYEDKVALELNLLGTHDTETLSIKQISGIKVKTVIGSLLGIGGSANITIYGTGNQELQANLVKLQDAKKAEQIINDLIRG